MPIKIEDLYARADAVFVGIPEELDGPYPIPQGDDAYSVGSKRYRLRVLAIWKGDLNEAVDVGTHGQSSACGANLALGEAHLIFAYRTEVPGLFSTSLCSSPRAVRFAVEDSAVLGPPLHSRISGSIWQARPPARCPVHLRNEIAMGSTEIIWTAPRGFEDKYRAQRPTRFPYASLQIDRPSEAVRRLGRKVFRNVEPAWVCDACRSQAWEWAKRHGGRS